MRVSLFCSTIALAVAVSSPAHAEEQAPRERTAWPLVLGATGVVLAGTSMYFATQWIQFNERADDGMFTPAGERCEGMCIRISDDREKARLAASLSLATGVLSLAAIGSAIIVHAIEGKPSKTAIAPVVAPGYGGAALSTTF